MVKVTCRLSELGTIAVDIDHPERLDQLLTRVARLIDIEPGGVIAVRDGKVVSHRDWIRAGDAIDVFPAISGG